MKPSGNARCCKNLVEIWDPWSNQRMDSPFLVYTCEDSLATCYNVYIYIYIHTYIYIYIFGILIPPSYMQIPSEWIKAYAWRNDHPTIHPVGVVTLYAQRLSSSVPSWIGVPIIFFRGYCLILCIIIRECDTRSIRILIFIGLSMFEYKALNYSKKIYGG